MILLFLFLNIEVHSKIDSLSSLLDKAPQLSTILELNRCYLKLSDFDKGIELLKKYEKNSSWEEKPVLLFAIAEDYFFSGRLLEARKEYLLLSTKYPRADITNDALERLYLIESVKENTALLKRLAYALYLFHIGNFDSAEDSLKPLLKSTAGVHACYYLALLYKERGEFPLALSALEESFNTPPAQKMNNALLLYAELLIQLDKKKEAQRILEELLVNIPSSIYAVRARRMLKQELGKE